MIRGETVIVVHKVKAGMDAFHVPTYTFETETVPNVLVSPASTDDLEAIARPEGDTVALALHFPKTYTASLRGSLVEVRGRRYEIQGDPQSYMDENTPGAWNRPVTATLVEG